MSRAADVARCGLDYEPRSFGAAISGPDEQREAEAAGSPFSDIRDVFASTHSATGRSRLFQRSSNAVRISALMSLRKSIVCASF